MPANKNQKPGATAYLEREGEVAFGMSKPAPHRRDLSDSPDNWAGWLEPGVEGDGNLKVASGRLPAAVFVTGPAKLIDASANKMGVGANDMTSG